jgi:hypothetical protein
MLDGLLQPTHVLLLLMLGGLGYVAFLMVRTVYRIGNRNR